MNVERPSSFLHRGLAAASVVLGLLFGVPPATLGAEPPPAPSSGRPGCGKDSDCKRDRVCAEGSCVEPRAKPCGADSDCPGTQICAGGQCTADATGAGATSPGSGSVEATTRIAASAAALARDYTLVEMDVARARSRETSGWILMGVGLPLGLSATVMAFAEMESPFPQIVGGCGLVLVALAGPSAGGAGSQGRLAARRLGLGSQPAGARVTGWIFYGLAMGTGAAAIVYGFAAQDGPGAGGIGGIAVAFGAGGVILLEMDSIAVRRQVAASRGRSSLLPSGGPRSSFALVPTAAPLAGGGGWAGLVGTW